VQQLEIEMGESLQNQILDALRCLDGNRLYMSRAEFMRDLERVLKNAGLKLKDPVIIN
jgi:type I restriction enzyme M protein